MTELQNQNIAIRLRHVVSEDGTTRIEPVAYCARKGKSIDALRCVGCARLRSMQWDPETGGEIVCATPIDMPRLLRKRAPFDVTEAAARETLAEVVPRVTVCVTASASAASVRDLLLARGLRFAPIVDDAIKLVGIVSRSDLMGDCDGPVKERAPACTHALPEHAPVTYAIALMAFESINEVPVVTEDGELVGVWTSTDALRWVAEHMGYVAPTSG